MNGVQIFLTVALAGWCVAPAGAQTLPGTKPLTGKGDLAAQMVAGIDKYLMRDLAASVEKRRALWKPAFSSPQAYTKSVEPNRQRLQKILGLADERLPVKALEYVATTERPALVGQTDRYQIYTVRWPVLHGVYGEGLLLEPKGKAVACVVALPDADQTPEMLVGLAPGLSSQDQFAGRLAQNGCRVLVPTLINRQDTWSGNPKLGVLTNQPHREFVYRQAFEMGRHIIGYEVQKVLAAVDWFTRAEGHLPVGVFGYGEGGLVALYSAALDQRIAVTVVSGYFGPREGVWQEPIYRNVWGLLKEFGDSEMAQLVLPRTLIVEDIAGPRVDGPPPKQPKRRGGAAPGKLAYTRGAAQEEVKRVNAAARNLVQDGFPAAVVLIQPDRAAVKHQEALFEFLKALQPLQQAVLTGNSTPKAQAELDGAARQHRQLEQLVAFTQDLLPQATARRQDFFWSKLDTSSPDQLQKSTQPLRDYFWEEIIGKLPAPTLPMNPRTRLIYDEPKWKGYEVVLDLYEDVFCYGILLVPNDLKPGERRPVVVCQHGLEGRPTDVVNPKVKTKHYNSFGAQLADRGYIVFAPQNPYIGGDAFRVLNRKGNPLKLSLYSFIVRQHERILDWLATLPFVDASRIAYYGLSYGGKVAMRIPALLGRYCVVICSGDFNEWIWKNITLLWASSYMFSGEYEMYEFDLGNTFNYAEMAALIAPRPFMVERGHNDGVGLDEYVGFEYAKVRRLYARLGIPERTEIEFFQGGHEIHGQGTFRFLDRHLGWRK